MLGILRVSLTQNSRDMSNEVPVAYHLIRHRYGPTRECTNKSPEGLKGLGAVRRNFPGVEVGPFRRNLVDDQASILSFEMQSKEGCVKSAPIGAANIIIVDVTYSCLSQRGENEHSRAQKEAGSAEQKVRVTKRGGRRQLYPDRANFREQEDAELLKKCRGPPPKASIRVKRRRGRP